MSKIVVFLLKKRKKQGKTLNFAWNIKNRPTFCDFDFFPDPQFHKIFKPIKKAFCTFLPKYIEI